MKNLALAAAEIGAERERERIVALLLAHVPAMPGGAEWVDRAIALIEQPVQGSGTEPATLPSPGSDWYPGLSPLAAWNEDANR